MKYIEDSIADIKQSIAKDKEVAEKIKKAIAHNENLKGREDVVPVPEQTYTIVRIETDSGIVEPRLIRVLEVGEDYFVGRGRKKTSAETFSFNHIASWRFAEYQPSEWDWK